MPALPDEHMAISVMTKRQLSRQQTMCGSWCTLLTITVIIYASRSRRPSRLHRSQTWTLLWNGPSTIRKALTEDQHACWRD